ncbi:MAG: T9SS type A sorting domain-containing protein [Bacteroidetes bacterium]|nr:MAG: T9SS type A sorting domain-containing protein [Bacteroidota bacterium]
MKKFVLFTFFFFSINAVQSQTLTSITPNQGLAGNIISAVITGQNTFFQVGCSQGVGQVRLKKDQCTVLTGVNVLTLGNDSVSCLFSIPPSVLNGIYDLEIVRISGGSLFLNSAFSITGGSTMTVSSILPSNVNESETVNFTLNGQNLGSLYNSSFNVSFRKGNFTFNSIAISVIDPNNLLVTAYVPAYIDSGLYDVKLTTAGFACYDLPGAVTVHTTAPKRLVAVSPNQITAGTTLTASISAENTYFMSGSPTGLNIIELRDQNCNIITGTNITVYSDTSAAADFQIPATARNGFYDVFLSTRMNTSYLLPSSVEITAGLDKDISSFFPSTGLANSLLSATVTGVNLDNIINAGPVSAEIVSSSGFSVSAMNILSVSVDSATMEFSLPVYADNDFYELRVNSATGCYTLPLAVQISGGQPRELLSINPASAYRGQSLTALITGSHTFFMSGTFPGGIRKVDFEGQMPGNYNFSILPPDINVLDSNQVEVTFSVPLSMPAGFYDVTTETNAGDRWTLHPGFEIKGVLLDGTVTFDVDSSGTFNAGDMPLNGRRVMLLPDSIISITNANGYYYFSVDSGQYTVTMDNDTNWFVTTSPTQYSLHVDTTDNSLLDFGLQPIVEEYDMSMTIAAGNPRCGTSVFYTLAYSNRSTVPTDGQVYFVHDPRLQYGSSTPAYDYISNDTMYWNYSSLQVYESRQILVLVTMPGLPGDTISNYAGATAIENGSVVADDQTSSWVVVRCSFDPNDKSVDPPGVGTDGFVLINEYLEYLIRFQNTGNDTAYNVLIVDTISGSMDMSSFSILANSHPLETHLKGNVVEFSFNNIMLPDSIVDEPASHGFVKYRIRAKQNISVGTTVENTAGIYFDTNLPVLTNTTFNTLTDLLPVAVFPVLNDQYNQLLLYPNPASQSFSILMGKSFGDKASIRIVNSQGQLIRSLSSSSNLESINVEEWPEGIYFILVTSSDAKFRSAAKLLRLH